MAGRSAPATTAMMTRPMIKAMGMSARAATARDAFGDTLKATGAGVWFVTVMMLKERTAVAWSQVGTGLPSPLGYP